MARLYRRKKRLAAHWILIQLVDENSFEVTNDSGKEVYRKEYSYITISELAKKTRKFPISIIRDAAHFLYKNQHVTTLINSKDYNETKLRANIGGEYAYRDSFYLMENRKDFNDTIDSYAKWIIPFISLLTAIFALYFSCNSGQSKNSTEVSIFEKETIFKDTTVRFASKDTSRIFDTIPRFTVDDYPISFEMMAEQKGDNSASFKKISGKTQSLDKAWFTNDTLDQTLVFELYTDGHRLATFHFYNYDIPTELFQRLELHTLEGEMADMQQEKKDFPGFLKQSVRINSRYFKSEKGIELGDNKEKILNIYGEPDITTVNKGVEKLEWKFLGELLYDGKEDLKGRPLAKNNYGHHAYLFFKNGKLIGQVLYNDIP